MSNISTELLTFASWFKKITTKVLLEDYKCKYNILRNKEKMNKITFIDIFREEKAKPKPEQAFISEVAKLTCKSQITVKRWCEGKVTPDALTQKILAEHFKVDADILFPKAI